MEATISKGRNGRKSRSKGAAKKQQEIEATATVEVRGWKKVEQEALITNMAWQE